MEVHRAAAKGSAPIVLFKKRGELFVGDARQGTRILAFLGAFEDTRVGG
jgi:hypothetical protein